MRPLILAALLAFAAFAVSAEPQPMFYTEVRQDDRIYVFASGERFDAFEKSGRTELGPSITRPDYGPNGETVVFDGEEAIHLYNFKHDLPGERFPAKPEETPEEKPEEKSKSAFPAGKLSGLMFGDYYSYDKWHGDRIDPSDSTPVEDQHGFWLRRIYLTYDLAFSERLTTRFRLEANSDGQFEGGNLEPYVKDAYLRWTYMGKHRATLGIHPSLTFDWLESFWGLRHIEKTPADLYRIDSSRDLGLSFSGPLAVDGLEYAVQYGNESGTGSEDDEYKIVRVEGRYERNPGVALEVLYSASQRPGGQDRTTAQAFAGYQTEAVRFGAQYLRQERESGTPGVADLEIDIWSAFVVWNVLPGKADLFARFDSVEGSLDGATTGLPGADGIDYLLLSPDAPFTTWIVGGEWFLLPSIRVGPNVELVKYDHDPDPIAFPGKDETVVYRLTFFWTF